MRYKYPFIRSREEIDEARERRRLFSEERARERKTKKGKRESAFYLYLRLCSLGVTGKSSPRFDKPCTSFTAFSE